jgi:aldose 1-epimerase
LASGHLLALDALGPESTIFANCSDDARYKAYNLGKGKGMSVLQIVEAMRHATSFDYKYEIIGRRYVILDQAMIVGIDIHVVY